MDLYREGLGHKYCCTIAALASGGGILISESTANRVMHDSQLKSIGKFALKNISEQVEIFAVLGE
jgi:class 3 adenylate cyclase